MSPIANLTLTAPPLRSLHKYMQTLTRDRHLNKQDTLRYARENAPCPRLQGPAFQSMIKIMTPQATTEHYPEPIASRRRPHICERRPRRRIRRRRRMSSDRNRSLTVSPNPPTLRHRNAHCPATTLTAPLPTSRRTPTMTRPLKNPTADFAFHRYIVPRIKSSTCTLSR